jgi:SHS2 domain-containing protein
MLAVMWRRGEQTMAGPCARPAYEVVEHTADIALRVHGASLTELFANAALGMFAQMADLGRVPESVQRSVQVEGNDQESLLVAWLSELLYLRETNSEAYARFEVRFPSPGTLEGVASGGPWHEFDRPVKAVTFHDLHIRQKKGAYEVTVVFDV